MVLRTEQDWDRDQEPVDVYDGGRCFEFRLNHERPFLFCKPCIRDEGGLHWSVGANTLVQLSERAQRLNPHFFSGERGSMTEVLRCPSSVLGRDLRVRLYLPPGYHENFLKRYPVLYMHDGANLFFPEEAFLGKEWQMDRSLDLLDAMSLIDRLIVVGVYADDRERDYTLPGYRPYARALVEELKPWIDQGYRTLSGPRTTAIMGSSLGGVVSFYCAWEHPEVFGNAACLSSTFGYKDDLLERVRREPARTRKQLKIYLDSGWPNDNYEVTLSMAYALIERGFDLGREVLHFAFPLARHSESYWGGRVHLPLQLFSGKARRAADRRRGIPSETLRLRQKKRP
ncbi:MAG: alpha/beta hydrolase [Planctomycetes bacterium]|nr:alpha/beta hydrolase [Planctomycetota bacterium]